MPDYTVHCRPTEDWTKLEMELRPSIPGGSIVSCSSTEDEFVEVTLRFDFGDCPSVQHENIGSSARLPPILIPEDWRLGWERFGPIVAAEVTVLARQEWVQPGCPFPGGDP